METYFGRTMLNKLLLVGLVSWLFATAGHHKWSCSAEDEVEQKVFPELLDSANLGSNQVHIVAESVSDEFGYETTEEYVNFETGKSTLVKTSKTGHSVTYLDAKSNLIYHYKPYECMAMLPDEVEVAGYHGIWNALAKLKFGDVVKEMRLYGVAAVWFNAGRQPKTYQSSSLIYSASKDVYKSAQKWTIKDEPNKSLVHMFFTEGPDTKAGTRYLLEMIQVESEASKKVTRTINILSFERYIPREVVSTLLEVPVGYGCIDKEATEKALIEFPSLKNSYMGPLLSESHKIELEVTATKFNPKQASGLAETSLSDTKSVTLVRHEVQDVLGGGLLQLIRHRDTFNDIKKILHYHYGVEYQIDLRTGQCKMSNLGKYDTKEKLVLDFNHGLSVLMDSEVMNMLFVDHEDYFFIKQVDQSGSGRAQYLYFERSLPSFLNKPARIVRTYSNVNSNLQLERVTVWLLDAQKTQVLESYHFNLIETAELKSGIELAKLFDVSEECYLNNEKMRANRDYAWFELTYTLTTRQREVVAANSMELKSIIYDRFLLKGHLSFFRVPKIELMFEDTGFVLRALLIDIPKYSVMFGVAHEKLDLILDSDSSLMKEVSVDEEHCADLCRLNKCRTFSFCESSHKCSMSSKVYKEVLAKESKEVSSCTTYAVPEFFYESDIEELSLHRIVSLLQHQDYGALSLPQMPEELTYPRSESGLDEMAYKLKRIQYLEEVAKYLEEEEHRLPMLTYSMSVEGALIILLPTRFELENDPLAEFNLGIKDETSQDEEPDRIPPFHHGLETSRYRIMSMSNPTDDKVSKGPKARLFSGLNYDQCALACVDSKCSSFSFCVWRQECIITDIYDISSLPKEHIQEDPECFIAQRDFVTKFNVFSNVVRSELYKKTTSALNPSECAHTCMVESGFKCLAFDYCRHMSGEQQSCYYFDERQIHAEALSTTLVPTKGGADKGQATGCDHYSRSYLADFQRIEYRQVDEGELLKLKTTTLMGRSVDRCAENCATWDYDCTAFQFCLNPDASEGPMQSCVLIDSVPQSNRQEFQVVVEKSEDGKVITAGKFFVPNINCHVFSLSRDSSEAQVRDLAFATMTDEELAEMKRRGKSSDGLSLGQGLLLYLFLTGLFAAIGCGFVFAKHHNDYLRQKLERIQILLGF